MQLIPEAAALEHLNTDLFWFNRARLQLNIFPTEFRGHRLYRMVDMDKIRQHIEFDKERMNDKYGSGSD